MKNGGGGTSQKTSKNLVIFLKLQVQGSENDCASMFRSKQIRHFYLKHERRIVVS